MFDKGRAKANRNAHYVNSVPTGDEQVSYFVSKQNCQKSQTKKTYNDCYHFLTRANDIITSSIKGWHKGTINQSRWERILMIRPLLPRACLLETWPQSWMRRRGQTYWEFICWAAWHTEGSTAATATLIWRSLQKMGSGHARYGKGRCRGLITGTLHKSLDLQVKSPVHYRAFSAPRSC